MIKKLEINPIRRYLFEIAITSFKIIKKTNQKNQIKINVILNDEIKKKTKKIQLKKLKDKIKKKLTMAILFLSYEE